MENKVNTKILGEALAVAEEVAVNRLETLDDIRDFALSVMEENRKIAKETALKIEAKGELKDVIAPLDALIREINYKEIETLVVNTPKSFLASIFSVAERQKDRLLAKYCGISIKTDALYARVRAYQGNIKTNNDVLQNMRTRLQANQEQLKEFAKIGLAHLNTITGEDNTSVELRAALGSKIGSIEHNLIVCEQAIETISIMLHSNFNLDCQMSNVYNTTLVAVQNQISLFKITREQRHITNTIKAFDEREKELIAIGTAQTIQLGKEIVENAKYKTEHLEEIKANIEDLKRGSEEILRLSAEVAKENQIGLSTFAKLFN